MFLASGGTFYTHRKLQRSEKLHHNLLQMLFKQGMTKINFRPSLVNLNEKNGKNFLAPLFIAATKQQMEEFLSLSPILPSPQSTRIHVAVAVIPFSKFKVPEKES